MDRSAIDTTDAFLTMVVYALSSTRWHAVVLYRPCVEFIINIYYLFNTGDTGQPGGLHRVSNHLTPLDPH